MESIAHIIKGCIGNEHKCQKFVYEHYRGFALKIVFRYIYQYEKAVDVVNEAFVKLFRNFHKFSLQGHDDTDAGKQLMAWMKAILVNTAIDELRKADTCNEEGPIPEYVWDMASSRHNADELLLYKELIILIKQLPPAYRTVFNLYVIDGYSHAEIAEMLNMTVGNSKSTLSRARAMLQKSIGQSEDKIVCRI